MNKLYFTIISSLSMLMAFGCSSPSCYDSRIADAVIQSQSCDYQGPKLIAKPYAQNNDGKVNSATYTFELIGMTLQSDERYILIINNMAKETLSTTMFSVDENQNLISVEDGLRLEEIPAVFNGFLSGEFSDIVLMEEVSGKAAVCHLVPKPIESSLGSKKITAELVMVDGSIYSLTGNGFEANEKINVVSISGGERLEYPIKASNKGTFSMLILTISSGCKNGCCNVKLSTTDNQVMEIKLPYGETLKRTMYTK